MIWSAQKINIEFRLQWKVFAAVSTQRNNHHVFSHRETVSKKNVYHQRRAGFSLIVGRYEPRNSGQRRYKNKNGKPPKDRLTPLRHENNEVLHILKKKISTPLLGYHYKTSGWAAGKCIADCRRTFMTERKRRGCIAFTLCQNNLYLWLVSDWPINQLPNLRLVN